MNALQAIKDRNPEALMEAFANVDQAKEFRREVLPDQSADDCRWFWQTVMTEEQLEQSLDQAREVCIQVAKTEKLQPGVHFSLGSLEGLPTLICSAAVANVFYANVPRDRHSVLRFYLQIA